MLFRFEGRRLWGSVLNLDYVQGEIMIVLRETRVKVF